MKIKYYLLSYIVLFACSFTQAQQTDPYSLIDNVQNKFSRIKDYQVDISIKVDVNFLRMPEAKAKITFKQPDKIKMESDGFALLPKQGLNFIPSKILNSNYTAIYAGSDTIDNQPAEIVKIVPGGDSSEVILSTLWIDPDYFIIRQIESTTKENGTANIRLSYNNPSKQPLPDTVVFSFNVSNFKMPMSMSADFENFEELTDGKSKSMNGSVTVSYSNYKVNTGIKDNYFAEDKDE